MREPQSALPVGHLRTYFALDDAVRVLVVEASSAADETRIRHVLGPEAARIAAEGLVSALLMSAHIKGPEGITLQIQGEKPRFSFIADIRSSGECRARLVPSELPPSPLLEGMLMVQKHNEQTVIYQGIAPLEKTGVEAAMQGYLLRSQQTQGRLRIGARLAQDSSILLAAGVLVEKLPGLDAEAFEELFAEMDPENSSIEELVAQTEFGVLCGHVLDCIDERELRFHCPCSLERARGILAGLGRPEIESLLAEQGRAEMTCHFCSEVWEFDKEQLEMILRELPGPAPQA